MWSSSKDTIFQCGLHYSGQLSSMPRGIAPTHDMSFCGSNQNAIINSTITLCSHVVRASSFIGVYTSTDSVRCIGDCLVLSFCLSLRRFCAHFGFHFRYSYLKCARLQSSQDCSTRFLSRDRDSLLVVTFLRLLLPLLLSIFLGSIGTLVYDVHLLVS
eukprot:COSAG02_NODE_12100_length_1596_cov_285.324649_1_plen_158_part_00